MDSQMNNTIELNEKCNTNQLIQKLVNPEPEFEKYPDNSTVIFKERLNEISNLLSQIIETFRRKKEESEQNFQQRFFEIFNEKLLSLNVHNEKLNEALNFRSTKQNETFQTIQLAVQIRQILSQKKEYWKEPTSQIE